MSAVTKPNMRREALRLASHGFRVFPLNGKIPIGGRGCLDATSDELQIESWWEQYPEANIGIAPGKGIVVIDIDNRRGGHSNLRQLVGRREWPKTVTVKSGGGGRHFYFGITPSMDVPNTKDRLGRGIEMISEGRYVVAPPSMHPISGRRYEWLRDPQSSPCAELPEWLMQLNIEYAGRSSWDSDKFTDEIKEGEGRNNFLTSYAGALRREGATVGEIYDALVARNNRVCRPPLSEKDVMTIARSVSRYDPEDPMVIAEFNDVGNGERFAHYAKGSALFVPGLGWHTWSGRRWRPDEGQIQEVAKRVVREIKHAAMDQTKENEEAAKNLKRWAHRSSSMAAIKSMLEAASTHPSIFTEVSRLDRGSYRFNMVNGTLDLQTGEMSEHRSVDYLTGLSRVRFDPEAECPGWISFLEDILPDEQVRDYVQRAVGYSLCGETKEQCFFLMYGTGSNGKTTFIQTIYYLMGSYASKMSTATIMGAYKPSNAATPELVRLRGPRFVVAAESGDGSRLNEATIKDLTGQDTIQARPLYKPPIEFMPQLKLWVYSNYKPTVHGMDQGIWRRIRLIPFTAIIDQPDKELGRHLRTELPGIFNWAYRGFLDWERYGLAEPQAILDEVTEYREMMDAVKQFVDEQCEVGKNHVEATVELWEAFSKWQSDLPYSERMKRNTFLGRLRDMGFKPGKRRIHGSRHPIASFQGLNLLH